MDTLPGALPLPDIQPGALPALRSTVLSFLNLTSTLPGSWGGSPDVLPALDELRLIVGEVTGSLPAGWAAGGFRRLQNLVLGCLQGVNARDGVPLEQRAAAAAAAAAASVSPATLPPAWGGGAFPALTSLTMHGLPVGGAFPASWLTPGAFPKLKSMGIHRMDVSGSLPERLFEANPSLTDVAFDECLFSGTLPARWGDSAVRTYHRCWAHSRPPGAWPALCPAPSPQQPTARTPRALPCPWEHRQPKCGLRLWSGLMRLS